MKMIFGVRAGLAQAEAGILSSSSRKSFFMGGKEVVGSSSVSGFAIKQETAQASPNSVEAILGIGI